MYYLDCCRSKIRPSKIINIDTESKVCKEKGYISEEGALLPSGLVALNEFETFLVKAKKKVSSEVLGGDYVEKVNQYKNMFPVGRLPSGELARQATKELSDKFVWFFSTYPEFDWTTVFDATHYYLHLKKLADFQYTMTSSYFIRKTDPRSRETRSVLSNYCQELIDNPDLKNH